MSLETLKQLSELFNSELQETKLRLISKKDSVLERFNLDKLNLQKELNQIEESLEFFEQENEMLVRTLMVKEKEFANSQFLFEYEKKALNGIKKDKLESVKASKEKIQHFLDTNKDIFSAFDRDKEHKISDLEEKIKSIEEQIKVYEDSLGFSIELVNNTRIMIHFSFVERPGRFFLGLELSYEDGEFVLAEISPKIDISNDLYEFKQHRRIPLFLAKVRHKFLLV